MEQGLSLTDLMAVLSMPEFELELILSEHLSVNMKREEENAQSYLIFSSPDKADTYHTVPFITGTYETEEFMDTDVRNYFIQLVMNMDSDDNGPLRSHCLSLVEYEHDRDIAGHANGAKLERYFAWRMMTDLSRMTSSNLGVFCDLVEDPEFTEEIQSIVNFYRQIRIYSDESMKKTKELVDSEMDISRLI